MGENIVVGIIHDENGRLEDITKRNARDFTYKNELGELVVYSFFEDIDTVSSTRQHFEALFEAITEKLLEKGIPVKGFIFTKDAVVALQEDDCTAYIVDWPAAADSRKVNVSVGAEDEDDDSDNSEDEDE